MKKDKKKFREALLDGFIEIVLTGICFGIGFLILRLFGVSLDSPKIDFDLIVLLGLIAPVVIFGIVSALISRLKKNQKKKTSFSSEAKNLDGEDLLENNMSEREF